MKVSLGAGEVRSEGYWHLDIRHDCQPDLVADVRCLPFRDSALTHLLAHDILEHFPTTTTAPLLREWRRVLQPGGVLELRVPNLHALAVQIAYWHDKPGPQLEAFLANVYGGHRWGDWDTHHTGWTPTSLRYVLDSHGFDTLSNDEGLNQTVTARKRDDHSVGPD